MTTLFCPCGGECHHPENLCDPCREAKTNEMAWDMPKESLSFYERGGTTIVEYCDYCHQADRHDLDCPKYEEADAPSE